jgi:CRP/FNR family transcriptional regulator, dissimilatory nitrate respiration regulator
MPEPSALALMRRLPYFAQLSETQLAALSRPLLRRHFEAGESIVREGESTAGMWIIEQGHVKVFHLSPEGREHILRLFGPGDSFNDVTAIDGGPNPAGAGALSAVTLWLLPHDALAAAYRDDHQLALAVIGALAGNVRSLVSQIEELALYSVMVRLARFLIAQSENPALTGITRAAIAAHLATTPETVSRTLRTLETIGAVRSERHEILVARPDLLREIAML